MTYVLAYTLKLIIKNKIYLRTMDDEDVIIIPQEGEDMGTVVLMLGLYLIVLAFFILLNTMAVDSPTRSAKAAASVAEGFGFRNTGAVQLNDSTDITMNAVFETIAEEMLDIMETYISVRNFRFSQNADEMVLRIDTDVIFPEKTLNIRPEMAPLFYDLAHTISEPKSGTHMVAQIMIHTTDDEQGSSRLSPSELAIRRATLFTRAIAERGVEGKNISAGTIQEARSEIVISFKIVVSDYKEAEEEGRQILQGKQVGEDE